MVDFDPKQVRIENINLNRLLAVANEANAKLQTDVDLLRSENVDIKDKFDYLDRRAKAAEETLTKVVGREIELITAIRRHRDNPTFFHRDSQLYKVLPESSHHNPLHQKVMDLEAQIKEDQKNFEETNAKLQDDIATLQKQNTALKNLVEVMARQDLGIFKG